MNISGAKTLYLDTNYKWVLLILGGLTNAVVVAIPSMGLSVLLPEITRELNLSLVQAGLLWGIGALPVIVSSLLAGTLCDRFGPKRILTVSCLLVGLSCALRGFSTTFPSLTVMVFLFGFFAPLVSISNMKTAGIWFSSRELGFANGVLSLGMAVGFLVGSMVSATILSPWLGGWRNVFFFYGAIAAVFLIPWSLTHPLPGGLQSANVPPPSHSFFKSLSQIGRLRNMWLLGFGIMGISGSIQGLLGYLPLYLHGLGWSGAAAGGVLASFHTASMICVLPIALWSDRLGSRKRILIGAALLTALGIGSLSIVNGNAIWGAVIVAGLVRDGFMAIFLTMVFEIKGIGPHYSGTAIGFAMIFMGVGNLAAPPLGNALAGLAAGAPFIFWATLILIGSLCIALTTERVPEIVEGAISTTPEGEIF